MIVVTQQSVKCVVVVVVALLLCVLSSASSVPPSSSSGNSSSLLSTTMLDRLNALYGDKIFQIRVDVTMVPSSGRNAETTPPPRFECKLNSDNEPDYNFEHYDLSTMNSGGNSEEEAAYLLSAQQDDSPQRREKNKKRRALRSSSGLFLKSDFEELRVAVPPVSSSFDLLEGASRHVEGNPMKDAARGDGPPAYICGGGGDQQTSSWGAGVIGSTEMDSFFIEITRSEASQTPRNSKEKNTAETSAQREGRSQKKQQRSPSSFKSIVSRYLSRTKEAGLSSTAKLLNSKIGHGPVLETTGEEIEEVGGRRRVCFHPARFSDSFYYDAESGEPFVEERRQAKLDEEHWLGFNAKRSSFTTAPRTNNDKDGAPISSSPTTPIRLSHELSQHPRNFSVFFTFDDPLLIHHLVRSDWRQRGQLHIACPNEEPFASLSSSQSSSSSTSSSATTTDNNDAIMHLAFSQDGVSVVAEQKKGHEGGRSPMDRRSHLEKISRRSFSAQAVVDQDLPLQHLPPLQAVGPIATQFTLVFTSSGYSDEALNEYLANSSALYRALLTTDYASLEETNPFLHYVSTMNIFSLFVHSNDEGVTDVSQGVTKDTSMKCSIISRLPQFDGRLRCDRDVVAAYAEATAAEVIDHPKTTLTIVLVNSPIKAAGSLNNPFQQVYITVGLLNDIAAKASLESKRRFLNVISHAVGHSVFQLADEVGQGESETGVVAIPNCASPSTPLPWAEWIVEQRLYPQRFNLSDNQITLLDETPTIGCQFDNYLKPSQNCLMGSRFNTNLTADQFFCPICSSHMVASFVDQVQESRNSMNDEDETKHNTVPFIFWPICPLPGEIVITTIFEYITLNINKYLTPDRGFSTTWSVSGQIIASNVTSLVVEILKMVELGQSSNFDVEVYVRDLRVHQWLLSREMTEPTYRNFSTKFSFQVVNNPSTIDGWVQRECTDPLFFEQGVAFRALCTSPLGCQVNYTTDKRAASVSQVTALRQNTGLVAFIFIILLIVLLPWIIFARKHIKQQLHHTKDMSTLHLRLPLDASERIYRNLVFLSSLVILLSAMAAVLTAIKLYVVTLTLTTYPLVAILFCSLIFQFVGFLAFTGVLERNPVPIMVSGVVLSVLAIVLLAFVLAFSRLDEYLADPDGEAADEMKRLWIEQVKENPNAACEFQKQFECSGWDRNCLRSSNSSITCPENCDANSKFDLACSFVAVQAIRDKMKFVFNVVRIAIPWLLLNNLIYFLCARSFKRIRERAAKSIAKGSGVARDEAQKKSVTFSEKSNEESGEEFDVVDDEVNVDKKQQLRTTADSSDTSSLYVPLLDAGSGGNTPTQQSHNNRLNSTTATTTANDAVNSILNDDSSGGRRQRAAFTSSSSQRSYKHDGAYARSLLVEAALRTNTDGGGLVSIGGGGGTPGATTNNNLTTPQSEGGASYAAVAGAHHNNSNNTYQNLAFMKYLHLRESKEEASMAKAQVMEELLLSSGATPQGPPQGRNALSEVFGSHRGTRYSPPRSAAGGRASPSPLSLHDLQQPHIIPATGSDSPSTINDGGILQTPGGAFTPANYPSLNGTSSLANSTTIVGAGQGQGTPSSFSPTNRDMARLRVHSPPPQLQQPASLSPGPSPTTKEAPGGNGFTL